MKISNYLVFSSLVLFSACHKSGSNLAGTDGNNPGAPSTNSISVNSAPVLKSAVARSSNTGGTNLYIDILGDNFNVGVLKAELKPMPGTSGSNILLTTSNLTKTAARLVVEGALALAQGSYQLIVSNAYGADAGVIATLKGDTGAQGVQGIQGVAGPAGGQGLRGPTGLQGPSGLNGVSWSPSQETTTPYYGVNLFDLGFFQIDEMSGRPDPNLEGAYNQLQKKHTNTSVRNVLFPLQNNGDIYVFETRMGRTFHGFKSSSAPVAESFQTTAYTFMYFQSNRSTDVIIEVSNYLGSNAVCNGVTGIGPSLRIDPSINTNMNVLSLGNNRYQIKRLNKVSVVGGFWDNPIRLDFSYKSCVWTGDVDPNAYLSLKVISNTGGDEFYAVSSGLSRIVTKAP